MPPIELSKQNRVDALASLKRHIRENMALSEPIGDLGADMLLNYFIEEIGPAIYNRAIADAQARMLQRVQDLDCELFSEPFQYWPKVERKKNENALLSSYRRASCVCLPTSNVKIQTKKGVSMPFSTRTSGEREDRVTGAIESQTAKIPSSGYLALAISSMAASAVLKAIGRNDWSLFVGQWAPAFLIIGVYNKLVKQQGSDAYNRAA